MYNFIFYVIYSQQKQKGKSEKFSIWNGYLIVAMAIFIHLVLLFVIIKKILLVYYNISIPGKYLTLGYVLQPTILFLAGYWYRSNNRTEKIMNKFLTDKDPTRYGNFLKVKLILAIPIIILFYLGWHS